MMQSPTARGGEQQWANPREPTGSQVCVLWARDVSLQTHNELKRKQHRKRAWCGKTDGRTRHTGYAQSARATSKMEKPLSVEQSGPQAPGRTSENKPTCRKHEVRKVIFLESTMRNLEPVLKMRAVLWRRIVCDVVWHVENPSVCKFKARLRVHLIVTVCASKTSECSRTCCHHTWIRYERTHGGGLNLHGAQDRQKNT